jgi:RHS repeat-associated protein
VVKETNATSGNVTDYLYGDDLIKQSKAANDSYYLYDGLGSTRALSDSTGTVTDTYNYESFGSLLNQTGSTENDYLFTGEQYDSGLDNYYLRARYYDQNIGRFTQQDTWMGENQDPITLHKYLYANIDPVNNVDPTGNFSMASVMTAVNIAGTLSTIASTAVEVFSIASGESEFSAVDFGTNVLLSRLPVKYVKSLYKKLCFKKNSFVAGTLVHTDTGLISIENIKIGQRVLTFNTDEGLTEYKEVVHLIEGYNEYELVVAELFNGDAIKATSNHPFYADNEWIEAKDLTVEMMLNSYDGEVAINSTSIDKEHQHVYNLTVKDNHNYYVGKNGVLVKNSTPKGCNIFNKAGEIDRTISISSKKLQSKWKHAKAFGVSGNFSMKNAEGFRKAIDQHVKNIGSTPIAGTYRGQDVIHYLNNSTGLNVIKDLNGNFISGWKLSAAQLKNVTSRGSL